MNQKELKELIEFLIEKDIAEFELERGDVKVRIKRGVERAAPAPPLTQVAVHTAAGFGAGDCIRAGSSCLASAESTAPLRRSRLDCTRSIRPSSGRSTSVHPRDLHPLSSRATRSKSGRSLHRRSYEADE